jgi:nicotinate-nucleotide adenylyltransferase
VEVNGAIGVFGGTFDPVHHGHLRPAFEVMEALALEEVRFIPARQPPHRPAPFATAEQRQDMLQLAVAGEPRFTVDGRELEREGPSYMVDTLRSLRADFGDVPLCLMLGSDAFLGLASWHEWQAIPQLAHLVVAHRPGWELRAKTGSEGALELLRTHRIDDASELLARPAGGVWLQPVTPLDISATALRELIGAGKSARYLLPDAVWRYIEKEGLYR